MLKINAKFEAPDTDIWMRMPGPDHDFDMQQTPLGLLSWLVAIAVWLAWSPFEARSVWGIVIFQIRPSIDLQTAFHLLLLVPVAIVLAVIAHKHNSRRSFMRAWGMVVLFGLILELGQWWVHSRGLSPYDALCNCIGGTFALWGTDQLMRRGIGAGPILVTLSTLMFVAIQVGAVHAAFMVRGRHQLTGWDPRFVVRAGDERGNHRTYPGHVWNARICAGEPSREVCIAPEADKEARYRLTRAAADSQRIELSAYVYSSTEGQRGPTPIVTFSQGIGFRNVLLGQYHRNLFVLVRTPWNGPDGKHSQFLPDAVPTGVPTWVTATFIHGVITITAKSAEGLVGTTYDLMTLSQNLLQMLREGKAIPVMWRGRAAVVGGGILFVSFGIAVGWILRCRWRAAVLAAPIVAISSLLALDTWVLGTYAPGVMVYLSAMAAAALGVGLAVWDWNRMP